MTKYSEEARRKAAEQLAVLGWGEEWKAEVHPDEVADEVRRICTGSGILIPAHKLIDLQCRVNELEEALKDARRYAEWKRDHAQTRPAMVEAARGLKKIDAVLSGESSLILPSTSEVAAK